MKPIPLFTRFLVLPGILAAIGLLASCSESSNPVDPDTLPPFVAWVLPDVTAAGDTVFAIAFDTTTVQINAGDDGGVISSVRVYLDGTVAATLVAAPYRTVLSLAGIPRNRSARVWATATDSSGKVGSTADTLRFIRDIPPDTARWSQLSPARRPLARDGFTWDLDPAAGRALLFGGYSVSALTSLQDLWSFNFSTDQWDSLSPDTVPDSRTRHASGLTAGKLVIFGGQHIDVLGLVDSVLEDYSVLDVSSLTWSLELFDFELRPAAAMSSTALGDHLWIYGGTSRPQDDSAQDWFWRYSVSNDTWQSLAQGLYAPGRRVLAYLAASHEDDKLFLYGGTGGRTNDPPTANSNYLFDVTSLTWESTVAPGPPALKDGGLVCDSALHRILLWGGRDGGGGWPVEVWQFSLGTKAWQPVPVLGTPPAGRSGHRLVYDAAGHRLVLFGGLVSGSPSDETWVLAW